MTIYVLEEQGMFTWPGENDTTCILAQHLHKEVRDPNFELQAIGFKPSENLLNAITRLDREEGNEHDMRYITSLAKCLNHEVRYT